jgi:hypothetical protein
LKNIILLSFSAMFLSCIPGLDSFSDSFSGGGSGTQDEFFTTDLAGSWTLENLTFPEAPHELVFSSDGTVLEHWYDAQGNDVYDYYEDLSAHPSLTGTGEFRLSMEGSEFDPGLGVTFDGEVTMDGTMDSSKNQISGGTLEYSIYLGGTLVDYETFDIRVTRN